MGKLEISTEYKFQKGGSMFYLTEGQSLKVKTKEKIYEGKLIEVAPTGKWFCLCLNNEKKQIKIECNNVLDIMPM